MKTVKLMFFLTVLGLATLVNGQEMAFTNSSDAIAPTVSCLSWEKTTIDVGIIKQNNPAEVSFLFKNTSDQPVVITDVKTSCGCTAANHSQEPVKPGESSKITVTYNAKSMGAFHKSITVKTSADTNPIVLTLSGEVK